MAEYKLCAQNKKARHDYFIEDTFEAGLELFGTEVKSIKNGKVSIKESYAEVKNAEIFVLGMNVTAYDFGNRFNQDPLRPKKLLLHKREIHKLMVLTTREGYTLIPLKVYVNERGLIKLQLAVGKGKKNYDKRETMAKKDANRRIEKAIKDYNQ